MKTMAVKTCLMSVTGISLFHYAKVPMGFLEWFYQDSDSKNNSGESCEWKKETTNGAAYCGFKLNLDKDVGGSAKLQYYR